MIIRRKIEKKVYVEVYVQGNYSLIAKQYENNKYICFLLKEKVQLKNILKKNQVLYLRSPWKERIVTKYGLLDNFMLIVVRRFDYFVEKEGGNQ